MSGRSTCSHSPTPVRSPQLAELESRIATRRRRPPTPTAITISYARSGLPPGSIGFPDLLTVAQALRAMLGSARALRPQDFSLPEADARDGGGATDLADLNARAAGAGEPARRRRQRAADGHRGYRVSARRRYGTP